MDPRRQQNDAWNSGFPCWYVQLAGVRSLRSACSFAELSGWWGTCPSSKDLSDFHQSIASPPEKKNNGESSCQAYCCHLNLVRHFGARWPLSHTDWMTGIKSGEQVYGNFRTVCSESQKQNRIQDMAI